MSHRQQNAVASSTAPALCCHSTIQRAGFCRCADASGSPKSSACVRLAFLAFQIRREE